MGALFQLSPEDIALQLARHTRQVLQNNWRVDEPISNTQFKIGVRNPGAVIPNLTNASAWEYVGALLEFDNGVLSGLTGSLVDQTPIIGVGSSGNAGGGGGGGSSGSPTNNYGRVSAMILSVSSATPLNEPPVTTLTLVDSLPAQPAKHDAFTVFRRVNGVSIPVPGATASGTAVNANAVLFTSSFTVPAPGIITVYTAPAAGTVATALQSSTDSGATWATLLFGVQMGAMQPLPVVVPVNAGDQWNLSYATATTVGILYAWYSPGL